MPRSYLPRSYLGGLGVRAASVIDRVCSEPSGWSQNWVTSQTSTTKCPVRWDQVSFFLVKPSGALRLLAAPRLSFVLQFQEAEERSDTKGQMPKLPAHSRSAALTLPGVKQREGTSLGSWAQGVLRTVGVRPSQPPPDFAKSCSGDWRPPLFPPPWVFPTCISADAGALMFCP